MPSIRPYRETDREAVEAICIATAPPSLISTEKRVEQTLLLYNRYYTRAAQGHCFVLANDADLPVGYILCAPDYKQYKKEFLSHEIKALCRLGPAAVLQGYGEIGSLKPLAKRYPAHLHIDLLPEYQHRGYGRKLMDCLTAHLQAQKVPGLMLIASAENRSAIAFYHKYGFEPLGTVGGSVALGLILNKK